MAGALTIALLLTLSFVAVRIAAVAMRHTGLPEDVARFQCLSALTGTGFTTGESEMIVNYPVRRRILAILMILGNLGLVSIAATFIVSFVDVSGTPGARIELLGMILAAIAVTLLVMINKTVDRKMCDLMGTLLQRTTVLGMHRYHRVLQLSDGFSVAKHAYPGSESIGHDTLAFAAEPLSILGIHRQRDGSFEPADGNTQIATGDILVCCGPDDAHDAFEAHLLKSD